MKSFLEVEIVAQAYATIGAKRVGSQETELVFRTSDSATLNEALRINKHGYVQVHLMEMVMSDSNLMAMALEFKIRPLVVILIFTQTV